MENFNRDKIIEKINNLFDLSKNNPNENEAIAAAMKAQELMAKYDIHMSQLDDVESIEHEIVMRYVDVADLNVYGNVKWRYELARIVAKNFRCDVFFSGKAVVFVGYKTDADIANETFKYLFITGNKLSVKLYDKFYKEGKETKGVCYAYQIGFVRGVDDVLDRQAHELLVVTSQEVHDKFDEITSGATMRPMDTVIKATNSNLYAYSRGRDDGKSAVESRRIEEVS